MTTDQRTEFEGDFWLSGETYPVADLLASRQDRKLQKRMRREILSTMCAAPCPRCPEYGSTENVTVFWFCSPEWTWGPALCGRAGVVAWCELHERQVGYVEHVMS